VVAVGGVHDTALDVEEGRILVADRWMYLE
jgi:hypothetical protein